MGFFGGVGNACLTNIIICDILILLGYEFMKVSELIKLLQRNQCYLLEHGKEHDKWHSERTGKIFVCRGIRAVSYQLELRIKY